MAACRGSKTASRAGSSGNRASSRETHAASRGVTLPAAGLRFTQSSKMVAEAGTTGGRHPSLSPSPSAGAQRGPPLLTVQQRGRQPVQHARGTLGDALGHQRGAGAHRLCRHRAAGRPVPVQRPVVEDLHHGLFQGCVGTGGRDREGETPSTAPGCGRHASPPAEPGDPLRSSPPSPKTPREGKDFYPPWAETERGFGWAAPVVPVFPPAHPGRTW